MGGSALNPGTSRLGKLAFEFVLYIAAAVLTPLIVGMIFFALLPSPIEGWIAVPLAVLSCLFVLASIGQNKFPIITFGKKKQSKNQSFSERTNDVRNATQKLIVEYIESSQNSLLSLVALYTLLSPDRIRTVRGVLMG